MWCIISEDRADLPRHLAIDIKPSRNEDQSRALPLGGNGGHSRAHTEWTGFVTGRRHHAPRARAATAHRLPPQFGIVASFDRCEKGIHVDVDYFSRAAGALIHSFVILPAGIQHSNTLAETIGDQLVEYDRYPTGPWAHHY